MSLFLSAEGGQGKIGVLNEAGGQTWKSLLGTVVSRSLLSAQLFSTAAVDNNFSAVYGLLEKSLDLTGFYYPVLENCLVVTS